MKKVALGFLCGIIVAVSFTVFAAQMEVISNPYKVLVNNQEANIEGYNIDGSTYFKLRDVGAATGFDVGFENDTILITTSKPDKNGPGKMTLEEMKTKLAEDVASGKITQAQADEMITKFGTAPMQSPAPTSAPAETQ